MPPTGAIVDGRVSTGESFRELQARRLAGSSAPPGTPGARDPFTIAASTGSTGAGRSNTGPFAQGGLGATDPAFQRDVSSFFGGVTLDDVITTAGNAAKTALEVSTAFKRSRGSSRDIFALEGPEATQTGANQDASGRLGVASGPPADQSGAIVQVPFLGPVDLTKIALFAALGFAAFAIARRI